MALRDAYQLLDILQKLFPTESGKHHCLTIGDEGRLVVSLSGYHRSFSFSDRDLNEPARCVAKEIAFLMGVAASDDQTGGCVTCAGLEAHRPWCPVGIAHHEKDK
jgi:hypothetical protein